MTFGSVNTGVITAHSHHVSSVDQEKGGPGAMSPNEKVGGGGGGAKTDPEDLRIIGYMSI